MSPDVREELERELRSLRAELARCRHELARRKDEVRDLRASRSWRVTKPLRAMHDLLHWRRPVASREVPASGRANRLDWGDLARVTPLSAVWGIDRGRPVDRYYIEGFLRQHCGDMQGRVLEVKDPYYATSIGGLRAEVVAVLDVDATNPAATLFVDLESPALRHPAAFDCFILTQTLHIIYDIRTALSNAVRLLAPGGVLLCTIPAVSRVNYENGGLESGDYWRLTASAVRRLFGEIADLEAVEVSTYGNVQVCAAFLYGLATEELSEDTLRHSDPWFPLVHGIRAVKKPAT